MATTYKNSKGEVKTAYTMKEQLAYHTERAKTGSVNPKTKKPYSDVARAKSRGWLSHAKSSSDIYKLKNPGYQKKKVNKKQEKIIFGNGPININKNVKIRSEMPFDRFDEAGNDLYNLNNKSKIYKTGYKATKVEIDPMEARYKTYKAYKKSINEKPLSKKEFYEFTKSLDNGKHKHKLTVYDEYDIAARRMGLK